jgi:hypothetical protein
MNIAPPPNAFGPKPQLRPEKSVSCKRHKRTASGLVPYGHYRAMPRQRIPHSQL